ncbi:MAG: response regulator [Flavisolibacter sp.]|jgi:CheY-like chemotaxis protein
MKKGIMLVDDDPEDREEFSDVYLAQFPGEQLYFAENGEKAIEYLEQLFQKQTQLCLIVLDLNMPILNGTQTLRKIKSDDRFKDIPVVIYSTSVNSVEKEECYRLGALDYMVKPSSFSDSVEIAKKLRRICRLY